MSEAEKVVGDALQELRRNWILLHSLWLKNHAYKLHGEIDFVLIGDRAVLLIEVKGGIVWRDEHGMWHFRTRSGDREDIKKEGPFEQIKDAFYAIRDHLAALGRIDLFHDYVWGYAVITPDCVLPVPAGDTLMHEDLLLDLRGFPARLGAFLDGVAIHWRKRWVEVKRNNRIPVESLKEVIPPAIRKDIHLCLRPLIPAIDGLGVSIRRADLEIGQLSKMQLQALTWGAENPRLALLGAAGTGKTFVAFEQARRQAIKASDAGGRVLFLCFNRLLASHLETLARRLPEMANVDVCNYHRLVLSLSQQAKLDVQVPEDWDRFNCDAVGLVLEAVTGLMEAGHFRPYEYLVMDEAQDLMHPAFFGAIDLLLKGEIKDGCWTLCMDPGQILFSPQFDRALYEQVLARAARATLPVNCRNTRQVAGYVSGLTDAGAIPVKGADGPDVEIEYYGDLRDQQRRLRKLVNAILADFKKADIPPGELVVLTTDTAFLPDEIYEPGFFTQPSVNLRMASGDGAVRVGTVQAFKGLEAPAVVLAGLEDVDSIASRRLLYVGGSRARSVLRILLPRKCSDQVALRMPRILKALASEEPE
jgi:hypothetical protein